MKHIVVFISLLLFSIAASSDDTDIYYKTGSKSGGAPLVMLSLDYRPNLANTLCTSGPDCEAQLGVEISKYINVPIGDTVTTFDALRAVYASVFEELEGVAVGMMINHDNNCTGGNTSGPGVFGCSNGGYILSGFREFELGDGNNAKADLIAKMNGIPLPQGNFGHSFQGKELYFELFRYLTGGEIYNGHLGYQDYGDTDALNNLDVDFPLASWDTTIENGSSYINPLVNVDSCSKLTAVNLLFQVANQEDDSDVAIKKSRANGGIGLAGNKITYPDVIKAMNQFNFSADPKADQGLTSYFISTNVNTKTNGYATAGGTGSAIDWADDAAGLQELRKTLGDIFREVLAVSGTFVSAAVPVNVFNRAKIDNNLFVALFSVDEAGKPLWPGNLKKLRIEETIGIDGESFLKLVDANGAAAIDSNSGRIKYNALTYWTDPNTLPPIPAVPVGEEEFMVDGKDGRFVKRGGAGQKIPGYVLGDGSPGTVNLTNASGDRKIFTQDGLGGLMPLDATLTNANDPGIQAELGAADAAEAMETLVWARGNDPATGVARDWLVADILHSRPLPVNYGARGSHTEANPDIRILMGTNDGFMHMFRNTLSGGSQSGVENWAFMPRSLMPILGELKDNMAGTPPHPYGVDGAATVYTNDVNNDGSIGSGDQAWAFFGMRRGGNNIYALDISNPDSPEFMWEITGGVSPFGKLAMTFSKPTLINIQYGSSSKPALIFGGGYNGGWDLATGTRIGKDAGSGADSVGNAIFIVDAETGSLIWKAVDGPSISRSSTAFTHPDLVHSIPSSVGVLDSNGDGVDDRAYVGDTGGGVWRIDFPGSASDNRASQWQVSKLANLAGTGASADRRFFHKPDVVQAELGGNIFDAIILGSGDRADPSGTSALNEAFMIKDPNTSVIPSPAKAPLSLSDLGDITDTCLSEATGCAADLTNGWRLRLELSGEKVLSAPVTIFGTVYFTTYIPAGSSLSTCEPNEGTGRLYAVSLFDGSPAFNKNVLDDSGNESPSTKDDRGRDLASGGIPGDFVVLPPAEDGRIFGIAPDMALEDTGGSAYWKTFWYEKGID